jgi:hypothetical protein
MAFKTVTGNRGKKFSSVVKSSEMEKGATIEGHLVAIEEARGEFPGYNFILRNETGDVLVYGSGTMKYVAMDNSLTLGLLTRITAKGPEKKESKSGKKYTIATFDFEQDDENKIDVEELSSAAESTVESKRASVREQTARLAASAGGKNAQRTSS